MSTNLGGVVESEGRVPRQVDVLVAVGALHHGAEETQNLNLNNPLV